jgi:hypothetical protein
MGREQQQPDQEHSEKHSVAPGRGGTRSLEVAMRKRGVRGSSQATRVTPAKRPWMLKTRDSHLRKGISKLKWAFLELQEGVVEAFELRIGQISTSRRRL